MLDSLKMYQTSSEPNKKNAITDTLEVTEHFTSSVELTGSCSDCAFEGSKERKRGYSTPCYQEEMISLENKKLEWWIKHEEENDEDTNFFRSLVPYMKQLPATKSYS